MHNTFTPSLHLMPFCCHLDKIICFVFVSCVQMRVMEGSVVGVAGCVVQVDVHGKWVVFWVAEMYSVVAILSMADMACLNSLYACRNFGVYDQCWVCVIYWSWSYVVKFYCCRLTDMEDCGVSNAEYTFVHLVRMNRLESFVVCIVGKMAQDVGMVESVVVSFPSS